MISILVKKLDEADTIIRHDLTEFKGMGFAEREAYEKARQLIQEAITKLLKHQL